MVCPPIHNVISVTHDLFITVQPSVFKRTSRNRREEMRGAEEVLEDENTATEIPVDQVSFTDL